MDQKKKVKEEIETSKVLETLMKAYQEHAIQQINFSREAVLSSRDFTKELAEVFLNVKMSYEQKLLTAIKEKKNRQIIEGRGKGGNSVLVFLTANNKFYGEIVPKVSKLFAQEARHSTSDIVVIGRQGKDLMEQLNLPQGYKYFDVPDTGFSIELIRPALAYLNTYSKIIVYYGKFNNILSQDAVSEDISSDVSEGISEGLTTEKSKVDFIFEPSLEDVLDFFETQIFSLMFNQKLHEASLARFASRVKSMELSQNNITEQLKKLRQRQKRLREMELNKKQLQMLSGKTLWGTR